MHPTQHGGDGRSGTKGELCFELGEPNMVVKADKNTMVMPSVSARPVLDFLGAIGVGWSGYEMCRDVGGAGRGGRHGRGEWAR